MSAAIEAGWLIHRGPDDCPAEYRPRLTAVAAAWDTPVGKVWWRSIHIVVGDDPPPSQPSQEDDKAPS
jgi:hypothetical protein